MNPVIVRMKWASEDDMTHALRARISALPHVTGMRWEAVSVSALRDEVVVLVVLREA